MSPAYFWKCTPRKFNSLCKIHEKLNSPPKETTKDKHTKAKTPVAKKPTAYIDQIM